jgi:hypothetical protein
MRLAAWLVALVPFVGCSNVAGNVQGPDGGCPAGGSGDDGGGDTSSGDDAGSSACSPGDSDGLIGGCFLFDVTVTEQGFTPVILKAQNLGEVTLVLHNDGTSPHDFVVDCIPTPNGQGCPATSCFPPGASIPELAPGASATTTFVTPNPEGIYNFRSDVGTDSQEESDGGVSGLWGQFVVQ